MGWGIASAFCFGYAITLSIAILNKSLPLTSLIQGVILATLWGFALVFLLAFVDTYLLLRIVYAIKS